VPDKPASGRARRRRARRRRMSAVGAGVVVLAAGGSAAWATTDGGGQSLTTATIGRGSVIQTVEASGAVAASSQTAVSFAANGTVVAVNVAAGQAVTKGQALAQLNTTSLQSALDSANASVATTQQKLQDDETGQTSSTGPGSDTAGGTSNTSSLSGQSESESPLTAGPSSGNGGSAATANPSASTTALIGQIVGAQKAVVSAQSALDKGQAAVDSAQKTIDADVLQNATLRDAMQTFCGTGSSGSGSSGAGSSGSGSSGSGSSAPDCPSATADYQAYADTMAAASAVLDKAISAQDANVSALDKAVSALDALLAQLSTAQTAAQSPTSSQSTSKAAANGSAASSKSSGASNTTTTEIASASQLAADQAEIDSAQAQLTLAQQNLAAATLTSPITGTVASTSLAVGSGSAGRTITILGTGNQVVTINVPLSEIDQVKIGQPASIAVDGRGDQLKGSVTKIGILSSTAGSLTTFPVTVTLADASPAIHDGVGASVVVTTGAADDTIVAPNSAITSVGQRHTVIVVKNGKPTTTNVTIGMTGSAMSQVTKGLSVGDTVELADNGAPLPSSATTATTNNRFLGTLPGGGFTARGGNGGFTAGGTGNR